MFAQTVFPKRTRGGVAGCLFAAFLFTLVSIATSTAAGGENVVIPSLTGGYGEEAGVVIPGQTTGYGDGYGSPSGNDVVIPGTTTGYGESGYRGPLDSGTVRIPDQTTGYGEAPSGTIVIPGTTTGYGETPSGTVRIPEYTDGYGGAGTLPFDTGSGRSETGPGTHENRYIIPNVSIVDINTGKTIHLGDVDLNPVVERIRRGVRDAHRNDGGVFQNRERNLPRKPRGYYREYVVPTPGVRGVGPQRLVMGKDGEIYYSHDHYDTFIRVE